ncbi:cytochrome P450 [Streptomyces yunnanensis]|uniref:Cytochrome P450 n=1 Tax=Streptomyces yunnanensis TaxID=156453 RepID=A0ABY8AK57_9ACTN|nr:cytochrome P450 [Streptomyces yunnanensis]WEB45413.1 cytochrome P450 [Streptomyces yunnanensis]
MTNVPDLPDAAEALEHFPFDDGRGIEVNERFRELRQRKGLLRVRLAHGEPTWLVTRYADARLVLGDARFSRAMSVGRDYPRQEEATELAGLVILDAPEHTRLRKLLLQALSRSRMEALRPTLRAAADDLLSSAMNAGPGMDIVVDYAQQMGVLSFCALLGVPASDREVFESTGAALLPGSAVGPEDRMRRFGALRTCTEQLIAERRARPRDDLMSAMIQARDEEDRLTDTELIDLVFSLLLARFETIITQIPNCVYVLTRGDRALWNRLRANPAELPAAVEELLRNNASAGAGMFVRYAREDVGVGGTLVRAGEALTVVNESANHDPARFEDPDAIDFTRPPGGHLTFGHGAHYCAGAQLGRIDLQEGLGVLLTRTPELTVRDITWRERPHIRGAVAMRVTWQGGPE